MNESWLKISYRGDEADIDISGVIGGDGWFEEGKTADQVRQELKEISKIDSKVINVEVANSPGGSLLHGLMMYDLLTESKALIKTKGVGMVASAATLPFLAGKKENRTLSQNCLCLMHRVSAMMWGNIIEFEQEIKEMKTFEDRAINIYEDRLGISRDEIMDIVNENNGNGRFRSTEEMIEIGFASKEGKKFKMAAHVDKEFIQKHKLNKVDNVELINNFEMTENEKKSFVSEIVDGIKNAFKGEKPEAEAIQNAVNEKVTEIEAKFEGEKTELQNKVSELENSNEALNSEKSEVSEKLTAKETEVSELKAKFDDLEAENAKLKGGSAHTYSGSGLKHGGTPTETEEDKAAKELVNKTHKY